MTDPTGSHTPALGANLSGDSSRDTAGTAPAASDSQERVTVDAAYLAERRRLAEAATKPYPLNGRGDPGWRIRIRTGCWDVIGLDWSPVAEVNLRADAAFIADARTSAPVLVAECEHRRETVRIASKLAGKEIADFEPETIGGFLARVNGLRLREERANERIAALEAENARLRALTGGGA